MWLFCYSLLIITGIDSSLAPSLMTSQEDVNPFIALGVPVNIAFGASLGAGPMFMMSLRRSESLSILTPDP